MKKRPYTEFTVDAVFKSDTDFHYIIPWDSISTIILLGHTFDCLDNCCRAHINDISLTSLITGRSACWSPCPHACSSHDGWRSTPSRPPSRTRGWSSRTPGAPCSNHSTSFYASRSCTASAAAGPPSASRRRCRGAARGSIPIFQPGSTSSSPGRKCPTLTTFAYPKGES